MNIPIIDPIILTPIQKERLYNLYANNNFYMHGVYGEKSNIENDLLELLFGEEFFKNEERNK